jgi:hypothetical protein
VRLRPEHRAKFDEAMELMGKVLSATAPKWERLEGIAQEYVAAHGSPEDTAVFDRHLAPAPDDRMDPLDRYLELESAQWDRVEIPAALLSEDAAHDLQALDRELKRLSLLHDRWDQTFGHLALVFKTLDGWRWLDFASFEHYCVERLGMGERTVAQRVELERKLYDLPPLRAAMRDGKVSYEKARLLARSVDDGSLEQWIDRAAGMTCIALRRALEERTDSQLCARGEFAAVVPRRVSAMLAVAFRAARKVAGRCISPGECLFALADHFVETWGPVLAGENTVQKRVLQRDRGFCQVPGCSRAAVHAHHIRFRSRGGSDDEMNLISLCAAHHLLAIHRGWITVRGQAPDRLRWELGTGSSPGWEPQTGWSTVPYASALDRNPN